MPCYQIAVAEAALPDEVVDTASDEVSTADTEPVVQQEAEDVPEEVPEQDNTIFRSDDQQNPCDRRLDTYSYEKRWYDESQIYLNSALCEPAVWFDNFFADDRVFAEGRPGTYVRWRNEFTQDQRDGFEYKMGLSFSAELPGLQNRVRLTFESEDDEDLRDISPDGDEGATSRLGLQLDVKENVRSKFNISINLSPRVRFRYRYTLPIEPDITLRFTQELERDKGLNGARSLFDFEKLFKQDLLFRSSTEGKISEEYEGINLLQAFVFFQRISHKSSVSYETSVSGTTEPETTVLNYRVGVRFRKNFHREWLFYEIAPAVTWPLLIDDTGPEPVKERHSNWQLFFRLEVHFGNASRKLYKDYH